MEICSKYTGRDLLQGITVLHLNCADVQVCFLNEETVRLHVSFEREFHDASYVLETTAWPDALDSFMTDRTHISPFVPDMQEEEDTIFFYTPKVTLTVKKDPLQFLLDTSDGTELYSTIAGNPFTRTKQGRITAYSQMKEDDCFYGFGEKTGELNKNKLFLRERATDCMGYDAEKADTLYKHIPFYIQLNRNTKKAVGVFYHNFYESVFNMGAEKSNYWPRYSYWQANGGDIDLFLFGGGTFSSILDEYTKLTGRPALLPKRALGYQGSSMYYAELPQNSDQAIEQFVDTLKEEGFPLDGFHLSSGYTSMARQRFVFTWNAERFPDPKGFFHAMNERHAQVVPNVKPGVLLNHPKLDDWKQKDVFVKDSSDPSKPAVGRWWGGSGVFFDYTNPNARELWKKELKENLLAYGTSSVWNDNCEYDSLLDEDSICCYDGIGGTIGALKPIMSNLMCRLGREAVSEMNPATRPYMVCRSGCSGIQKYAQTWCGDNFTSWQTLKYNIPTITGMGLSGVPNEGADIGGFAGGAPEEELFVRWVQQGIFQPRFSIHSANNDNTVTDPAMYHGTKGLIRQAVRLRYRLAPYLYANEYLAHTTGAPIMRALVYDFQNDPHVYDESFTFLCGRDLLVANVLEKGASEKEVYLPADTRWYDWNNQYHCYEGGQKITVPVTLETIPMFLREGAVIAMNEKDPSSMAEDPVKEMHLIVAPAEENETILYNDDGVTNDYEKGVYLKTVIHMQKKDETVTMHFAYTGTYDDPCRKIHMEMMAKEKAPFNVKVEDHLLTHYLNRNQFEAAKEGWYYSMTNRTVEIIYDRPVKDYTLLVSFSAFDLIGM